MRAAALAVHGFDATRERLRERLAAMGARIAGESVNRVDYALDVRMPPNFAVDMNHFVAHPRTKIRPHWSKHPLPADDEQPAAVVCGRRLESVTVGKMPGRQVIVYDKRREAIDKRKAFWFQVWGVDRFDSTLNVWRVEARAGKNELTKVWNLRTFADIRESIGDVFAHALQRVRYVDEGQTDTNITRERAHPLWRLALDHVQTRLYEYRSGLTPGQLIELEREQAVVRYQSNLRGNIAGMAVALGLDDDTMEVDLPEIIHGETRAFVEDHDGRFAKSVQRVRERLCFISGKRPK